MSAPDPAVKAVHVTRAPMVPARPGGRCARWHYSYSVDGGPAVGYGTHLASLRDLLRRHFPAATVTTGWATA